MPKATVHGVDMYAWFADGHGYTAVEGEEIDVSAEELKRGEDKIGPRGPALVTKQARAEKLAKVAAEAAKKAADAAAVAIAEAKAAAAEAGTSFTIDDSTGQGTVVTTTDSEIAAMTTAEVKAHLAVHPEDAGRVLLIEQTNAKRAGVLALPEIVALTPNS